MPIKLSCFSAAVVLSLFTGAVWAQVAGGTCSGSITAGPDANGSNLKCNGSTWVTVATGVPAATQSNVSASRVIGTSYQNTTGQTLMASVTLSSTNVTGACYNQATSGVSSTDPTTVTVGYATGAAPFTVTMTFLVPAGLYYHCNKLSSAAVATPYWNETVLPF